MKKNFIFSLAFAVSAVLFSDVAFAQSNNKPVSSTKDLYLISAKAGGVNYIEGNVVIAAKNKKSGYLLKGDTVEIGDKVSTRADGKAEILLNPGSYVRLAENSSFEFLTTSLDNLRLKLTRGAAIFEVIADDDFQVAVKTPKAEFSIVSSGVYRVNVLEDGSGKIAVWKGKARVGNFDETEVKAGREATVKGSQVTIAKFDKDNKDALDDWSKTRAKDLARVNSKLQRQDLRTGLMYGFASSRWNMYNSFGLWVFDASFGSYCFLPFGYGWSSPYGYNYGRDLWYFRLPTVIYNQPPPATGGGSGGGTTAAGKSRTREIINSPMPYESIQPKMRTTNGRDFGDQQFPNINPPSSISPMPVNTTPAAGSGKGLPRGVN